MPKKIIIFASLAASLLNFRKELIQAFLDQGLQVVALAPLSTINPEFTQEFKQIFPQVALHGISMAAQGMNPLKDLKSLWALIQFFKREQPDYVFSYTIKPVIYGSIAARCAHVPHVFSMITGLATTFLIRNFKDKIINFVVRFLYKIAFKCNQAVIFQNPDDQHFFIQEGLVSESKSFLVAGSGVNLTHFSVVPLPVMLTFIFVGRLLQDKGIVEFLQAVKLLKMQYPEIKVMVLGGQIVGHPRGISQDLMQELENLVEYISEVKDVRSYLAKASVLVLPSYREGVPRSVLEALAMGRPVITTDVPGCRETVLEGVNGFLIPIKNVDALIAKMRYFIQNPNRILDMGLRGRNFVEKKFDVHAVNAIILDIILKSQPL